MVSMLFSKEERMIFMFRQMGSHEPANQLDQLVDLRLREPGAECVGQFRSAQQLKIGAT